MGRNLKLLKRINFWISDYFSVIRQGIGIIGRDNVNLLASGMVYSTLIAIVPCITFLSAFLSAFGALEPFLSVLSEWICDTFGETTGQSVMNSIVTFTGSAMSLGVVGLVSFIITGMFLVNKIYSLINHIFRTEPSEGTMKRFILILIFLIVLTVVLTFAFALTNTIHDKVYSLMGVNVNNGKMREHLSSILQFAIVFLVFSSSAPPKPYNEADYQSCNRNHDDQKGTHDNGEPLVYGEIPDIIALYRYSNAYLVVHALTQGIGKEKLICTAYQSTGLCGEQLAAAVQEQGSLCLVCGLDRFYTNIEGAFHIVFSLFIALRIVYILFGIGLL